MPGRHDSPTAQPRRWVPTAFDAVVAVTPATSLVAALGLAGGGYLEGREDVAACGAVVGALGLVVERARTRRARMRLRRERVRHRDDLQGVTCLLLEMQRDLAGLRTDLDDVRAERDAVRAELLANDVTRPVRAEGAATTRVAPGTLRPLPVRAPLPVSVPVFPWTATAGTAAGTARRPAATVEAATVQAIVSQPVLAVPVTPGVEPAGVEPAGVEPAGVEPVRVDLPRMPLSLILPGQVRSPIATGGIPLLTPGPRVPLRSVLDLRGQVLEQTFDRTSAPDDVTAPLPVMTAELADALVYAAIAEADAAEVTRDLDPAGRHAGPLHTGDAHHAGDYARDDDEYAFSVGGSGAPTLYVVRRGRHVA